MDEHPEVRYYLRRLRDALKHVPVDRREEIVDEVESHIDEELRALGRAPEDHEVRNVLETLGAPELIAAAEIGDDQPPQEQRGRVWDVAALVLLLVGTFLIPYVGWIIGVVLLWTSPTWTTKDKLLGTFVLPGGLAFPFFFFIFVGAERQSCMVGETFKVFPDGTQKRITHPHTSVCETSGPPRILMTILLIVAVIAVIAVTVRLVRRMRKPIGAL